MGEPSPFGPGNPEAPSLRYLFLRFLRYGLLAWGGPVAQIGMMHQELVERDRWVEEAKFRKVLALYQALPGPEAMELAVYFGMTKRGRMGGFLAGLAFLLPGVLFVTALAALYVHEPAATTGAGAALLAGVRPAVIALLVVAFLRLARASLTTWPLALVGAGAAVLAVAVPALPFLAPLLLGGGVALAIARLPSPATPWARAHALAPAALLLFPALTAAGLAAVFLVALKAGFLSFGGAYTALPFLQEGAVVEHGWMTDGQFVEGFALTGLVPGPLVAVATFVGYAAGGLPGALVATVGVFAPAFLFTLVGHQVFERLLHEPRLHAFLLGVTAAVVGLVVAVSVPLASAALTAPTGWAIAALAAGALLAPGPLPRWRVPVVIAASGALGLVGPLLGA